MNKVLLLNLQEAIKNTNRFLLKKNEFYHFNKIENRVLYELRSKNNNILTEDDILESKFKLSTNDKGEYVLESNISNDPLLQLQPLIDKSGVNTNYLGEKPHPKTIIGLIIEKGEIHVLLAHNTTEDKDVSKLIHNIKLNKPLDNKNLKYLEKINDPQYENYKTFQKGLDFKISRGKIILRSEGTWGQGEFGDNPFINVGNLPNGNTQFISGTLIKCKLSDLEKNFDINLKNLPPVSNRVLAQTSILSLDKVEIFDMSKGAYQEIISKEIYPINYNIYKENLTSLNNSINLEQFLCESTGNSWLSFKILQGLVLEINPVTSEIIEPIQIDDRKNNHLSSITESSKYSEFNTLPQIEVPKGPDL